MKTFDLILSGHEATEENAYDFARGIDWGAVETTAQHLSGLNYIDCVNGVEIYQSYDMYIFAPVSENKVSLHYDSKLGEIVGLFDTEDYIWCAKNGLIDFDEAYRDNLEDIYKQPISSVKKFIKAFDPKGEYQVEYSVSKHKSVLALFAKRENKRTKQKK